MNRPEFQGFTLAKKLAQKEFEKQKTRAKRVRNGLFALSLVTPVGGFGALQADNHSQVASPAFVSSRSEQTPISSAPTTIFFSKETTGSTSTTRPPQTPKLERPKPTTTQTTRNSTSISVESWSGSASYYSREGCLGCNPERIMANGKPLDDNALTIAFNRADLGTNLSITNVANGKSVVAEVTDRGGFEKYGKIADLNLGTRTAIDCPPTCNVIIARV